MTGAGGRDEGKGESKQSRRDFLLKAGATATGFVFAPTLLPRGLEAAGALPAASRISRRIAAGSSLRGLSSVTMTRSARLQATSPICGRLPRSRSPPQPNTT